MKHKKLFPEIKLVLSVAYYLAANFAGLAVPVILYGAYRGNWFCQILALIAVLDYAVPLHPAPKGASPLFRELTNWNDGIRSYFDGEVIEEGGDNSLNYDRNKNYCVCYFPHSLFGIGYGLIVEHLQNKYGMEFFFAGADIIFKIPFIRRIMTWWGLASCAAPVLKENLKLAYPHNALMLQPDGIAGMFYGLEQEQVVLGRRKGFCRVALQAGCELVPCYAFGANDMFSRKWNHKSRAARLSRKLRTSLVFWTDRFGIPFGCVPLRTKILVVLGKPIPVSEVANPTSEQIDALHAKFVTELKALYDRHKHRMGEHWARTHPKLYLETEEPESVIPSESSPRRIDNLPNPKEE